MIRVTEVYYEYSNKQALKNISFDIEQGSITALVGPNGAGKTTLMRCLAALDQPFSGQIVINDIDILDNPRKAHELIGYLSDEFGLYQQLTVRQNLTYIAEINAMDKLVIQKQVIAVTKLLHIEEFLDQKVNNLSRGQRQRVGIAMSIIHNPAYLILDEPASGLDPESRHQLSQILLNLRDQGMTVIVSSHILAELEDYCTNMLLLEEGKVIDHYNHQIEAQGQDICLVEISFSDDCTTYIDQIAQIDGISNTEIIDNKLHCQVAGNEQNLAKILKMIVQHDIPVCAFTRRQEKLHDRYINKLQESSKDKAKNA